VASAGFGFSCLVTNLLSWRYIFFAETILIVIGALLTAIGAGLALSVPTDNEGAG
jgi:hypothetical protein